MAARTRKKKGGFWDTYQDEGGGKYLTAPEKKKLIEDGTALDIVAIRYDEKNQYNGNPAPRFVVTFLVDGVERFAGFALSEDGDSSRDRFLAAASEALESGEYEKIEGVAMEMQGTFVKLVKADA